MGHGCLPDTDLAAVAIGNEVYTYMQSYNGVIIECHGSMQATGQISSVYLYENQTEVVHRYRGGREEVRLGGPKLFTPLAAAYIRGNSRHVFYLDDRDVLSGFRFVPATGAWEDCGLAAHQIRCAHYSKLAAIGIARNGFEAICVYYQDKARRTAINLVSFTTKNGNVSAWVEDEPDMEPLPPPPPPPVNVRDPPLYGTSLAAVPFRPGIGFVKKSLLPVVFLQWDNLGLARSQSSKVQPVPTLDLRFAPHTSLTTIDEGRGIQLFYISSKLNLIKRVFISDAGHGGDAQEIVRPTPRSALAVVIPSNDRMVLFYQSLDDEEATVNVQGLTLRKPVVAAAPDEEVWDIGDPERLG
ncbi:hypothetical protein N658DRAFT_510150 [Parathielavia hyrcaniae]|uniref:Fucose-specific lectin n=1 Tax=Parathielavia hyrcaniae TaxID=113614 RepID=A0AAN6SYP6_9PEZI|nr:hypothetical protein N658DRAFT_510150 [Parathielavia hyrcaniae]